jgi:tRNA A-37 threonylcarbamoyl transferase component Bud32
MAQQKAVEPVDEVDDLIDELQPGAKLLKGQYTITRYINSGGFGITYLAKDSLDRDVVIKECFPSSVCRRSKVMVAARSRAHTAELRSIVQLFVREARNLAKIVHPNIVAVHQVFEDNGTAYMAIDFIDGLDLQQVIDGEGPMLTPDHIVRITDKLLAAVGFIHDHDMLHRDISPDNVLVDKSGEPILIDFGAAREHASKTTRAMSALRVVKDGYSPQEFYIAGSEQGPWSDLYALAATLYHLISGDAPVNGQARLAALAEDRPDPYLPLTGRFQGYPPGYLEAIDRAMNTMPKARLQTATEWLDMYHRPQAGGTASVDAVVQKLVSEYQAEAVAETVPAPLAKAASRPAEPVAAGGDRGRSSVQMLAGVAVALIVVAGGYMMLGSGADPAKETAEAAPASQPTQGDAAAEVKTASAAAEPGKVAEVATGAETAAAEAAMTAGAATEPTKVEAEAAEVVAEDPPVVADTNAEPAVASGTETEAQTESAAATETPEPAAEDPAAVEEPAVAAEVAPDTPAVVAAAGAGKPSADQVAFAAWDVAMPFQYDDGMIDGRRVAVVTRFQPGVDIKAAGDWLAPGLAIRSVNGATIQSAGSLTVAVMNAMAVDPDGRARVVVEFSDRSGKAKTGLLTVDAVRLVTLQNGIATRTRVVDGAWKTEITAVGAGNSSTLKVGDTLFRDKTTTTPLDSATALETILADLVAKGVTETEFSIIRDNKVAAATMRLAESGAP